MLNNRTNNHMYINSKYVGVRACGSVDVWVCGSVDVWVCVSVDMWVCASHCMLP